MADLLNTYDLVVGLGKSGLSMARFLKSLGRNVAAADIDTAKTAEAAALEALGVRVELGPHDQALFDGAASIIPSPGIPLTISHIRTARAKGVKILGELDIFSQYNTTPVIGVTGTNGKTTTVSLIGEMARACGFSCFVGGNIGTPLVEYLMSGAPKDLVVAEVSSFQLDLAKNFKPHVGVLLNISQDHLDRYPDYAAYEDAKWSIFKAQGPEDAAVINSRIPDKDPRISKLNSRVSEFSSLSRPALGAWVEEDRIRILTGQAESFIPTENLDTLPGAHNRENIAAAALAVLAAGGAIEGILSALKTFILPDHRLALVEKFKGIRFFNDSKATNTDAVIRALETFEAPIILILGGREKGTDFKELIPAVESGVKAIMAVGEARDHILETFTEFCPVIPCRDMADAVNQGYSQAAPGDVVLLSPACASFDMYDNYKERGRAFTQAVGRLAGKTEVAP